MSDMNEWTLKAETLLVLRCQLRDPVAFEALVTQCSGRIRYYIMRLIGPKEDLDDILQKVWLSVWTTLPRLRKPDSFRPWLYAIARTTAFQTLRGRVIEVPLDEAIAAPEPEEDSFAPQDAAAIHAALDHMPVLHKEVLVLRFLEEMTYEEIAAVVGCSVGTVRSRIHYGKKSLRRIMEESTDV